MDTLHKGDDDDDDDNNNNNNNNNNNLCSVLTMHGTTCRLTSCCNGGELPSLSTCLIDIYLTRTHIFNSLSSVTKPLLTYLNILYLLLYIRPFLFKTCILHFLVPANSNVTGLGKAAHSQWSP